MWPSAWILNEELKQNANPKIYLKERILLCEGYINSHCFHFYCDVQKDKMNRLKEWSDSNVCLNLWINTVGFAPNLFKSI